MTSLFRATLLGVAVLVLAACGTTPPPTGTAVPQPGTAYPVSTAIPDNPYPAPQTCAVPQFLMDRAGLVPGATAVTGTGPANVPVRIDSVFNMGKTLGTGTIGADGRFSIPVTPLADNDYVGLRLNEAGFTGTNLDPSTYLSEKCYYSPDAGLVPQVGFYFDRATVKAP